MVVEVVVVVVVYLGMGESACAVGGMVRGGYCGGDGAKHFTEYSQYLRQIAEPCAAYCLVAVFDAVAQLLASGLGLVLVFPERQLPQPQGCQLSAVHAHAATGLQGNSVAMVRAQDTLSQAVLLSQ